MATRNHFRVTVSLVLAISLHYSSSEASRDLPFFHQRMASTPRICKPQVLDRAVHCGCFRYRTFYRKYPEWSSIAAFCEGESDERLTRSAVLDDCRRSHFVSSGKIRLGEMNKYFKRANDVCMTPSKFPPRESESPRPNQIGTKPPPTKMPPYDVAPSEEPSFGKPPYDVAPSEEPSSGKPPYDVAPSEEPSSTEPPFEMPPTKVPPTKVPPTKVPPTKVSPSKVSTAKVPPTTAIPRTTLASGGKVYPSPATLEAETVRLRYEFIHKMLSRFCQVLVYRRRPRLSAAQVYKICCPRGR